MPGDDEARSAVLGVLASRIAQLPPVHRDAAWQAILDASVTLCAAPGRAAALGALATAVTKLGAETKEPCLAARLGEIDRHAMVLAGDKRATVHVAVLAALAAQDPRGLTLPPQVHWPFDLRAALDQACHLDERYRRGAIEQIIAFHVCRTGQPGAAWRDAIDIAGALRDPQTRAWTLIAMAVSSDRSRQPLLVQLNHAEAFDELVQHVGTLPADIAAETAIALAPTAFGERRYGPLTARVERWWAFSQDSRFDADQRSRMAAALKDVLPRERCLHAWQALLEHCESEGPTNQRRQCLARLFAGTMRLDDPASRRAHWDATFLHCASRRSAPPLAANLCLMLAEELPSLASADRGIAAQRLLERIDELQLGTLGYEPIGAVLPWLAPGARAAILPCRLDAVPPAVRARWLSRLVAFGETSRKVVDMVLAAVAAEPDAAGARPALLAGVLPMLARRMQAYAMDGETIAALLSGLPAVLAGVDLAHAPELTHAVGPVAMLAQHNAERSPAPDLTRQCAQFQAYWRSRVLALPIERRQAAALSLASNDFRDAMLDILPCMPPVLRVPVLLRWLRTAKLIQLDPAQQLHVWEAIRAVPATDQAPLLQASAMLFDEFTWRNAPVQAHLRRQAAKAEWQAAVAGLPPQDALSNISGR
jgi:hypothetical protein